MNDPPGRGELEDRVEVIMFIDGIDEWDEPETTVGYGPPPVALEEEFGFEMDDDLESDLDPPESYQ